MQRSITRSIILKFLMKGSYYTAYLLSRCHNGIYRNACARPFLEGKSSTGRLGIDIHAPAGKGDVGFCGNWTLEISVKQPVKVYKVCQSDNWFISSRRNDQRQLWQKEKFQIQQPAGQTCGKYDVKNMFWFGDVEDLVIWWWLRAMAFAIVKEL